MDIVSRSEWGAKPPRNTPTRANQTSVTFHWEGPHMGTPDHSQCAGVVRSIQAFHMGPQRGWNDIAYNYLVCAHGVVFEGRGRNVYNAASGTTEANSTSAAICYMGGEGDPFTDAAKRAMRDMANELGGQKFVHREWVQTSCPGDEIVAWRDAGCPVDDDAAPAPAPAPEPAPEATTPCEERVFGLGDEDRCVFYIQRLLNKRGFGLVDDGDFGPKTEAAVKTFQRNHRLAADGVVGAKTWKALWWGQTL